MFVLSYSNGCHKRNPFYSAAGVSSDFSAGGVAAVSAAGSAAASCAGSAAGSPAGSS